MNDHGILFRPAMVRALLAEAARPGSGKDMTRRLPSPLNLMFDGCSIGRNPKPGKSNRWLYNALDWRRAWVDKGPSPAGNAGPYWHVPCVAEPDDETVHRLYPKIRVGDRLWVRETWAEVGSCDPGLIVTRADYPACVPRGYENIPARGEITWRPGIHLRRRHSRLTLTVTKLSCERLHAIDEDSARREGAERMRMDDKGRFYLDAKGSYRTGFAGLWAHINGAASWDANPWVIAYTFTVEKRNIDA